MVLFIMATLVAWLLRFVDYILNKGTKKGRISLSEIRSSFKEILQLVQRHAFSEEIDSLSEARPVKCQSSGHEHVLSIKLQVCGLFKQEHCCTMFCESVSIIANETKRL